MKNSELLKSNSVVIVAAAKWPIGFYIARSRYEMVFLENGSGSRHRLGLLVMSLDKHRWSFTVWDGSRDWTEWWYYAVK